MSEKFKRVTDDFWASPQITTEDVAEAASLGVKLIINNRPDGEAPGQPNASEIEAAAKAAGLTYAWIPVDMNGLTEGHVNAYNEAVASVDGGATLAFCASGTRSIILRSYVAAIAGGDPDELISQAAAAGYDIAAHGPALKSLSEKS